MALDEALRLENAGRYAEYQRRSLEERARAAIEGRSADEAQWCGHAARACRRLGKAPDALAHLARAEELAGGAPPDELRAFLRLARGASLRCARRYDESLAALKDALDVLPPTRHDELRAEIFLETAETALEAGAGENAERALARGAALAQTLRDPRLLAWSLYLRAQLENDAPSSLQLAAAFELARRSECPELEWQILWRLSERAADVAVRDELIGCAVALLARLAETLDPEDATLFWRNGPRRVFVDQVQRRYGPTFLSKVMASAGTSKDPVELLRGSFKLDPSAVAAYLS